MHELSGLSKVDLFTLYSEFKNEKMVLAVANYFEGQKHAQILAVAEEISEVQTLKRDIPNFESNLWQKKKKGYLVLEKSGLELEEVFRRIESIFTEISEVESTNSKLFPHLNLIPKIAEISGSIDANSELLRTMWSSLSKSREELEGFCYKATRLIDSMAVSVENFRYFVSDVNESLMSELDIYYSTPKSFMAWLTPRFWRMRKNLKFVLVDKTVKLNGHAELTQWLDFFNKFQELNESLQEVKFEIEIEGISQIDELSTCKKIIADGKDFIGNSIFLKKKSEFDSSALSKEIENQKVLVANQRNLDGFWSALDIEISLLQELSGHQIDGIREKSGQECKSIFKEMESDSKYINQIDKVVGKLDRIEKLYSLKGFQEFFVSNLANVDDIAKHILSQAVKSWYESLIQSDPELQKFDSKLHIQYLEKYRKLVDGHRKLAKKVLNNNLAKSKGESDQVTDQGLKLLQKEASKQRKIKSPREIMEAGALTTMIALKKCWLMSPLSISQIMPNVKGLFDVVIFDEASQVRVEDAIPSIYRGNNLIVVGDNKQMPPTNFFSGIGLDDDLDDEEDIELGESVLDQALKSYPDILLEWHYRSQFEALIAFSNYAFYGGRLIAPPNPGTLVKNSPIEFEYVRDGTFSSKTGNLVEAKMIVAEISQILNRDPNASIGVISMGMSQQKAIEKMLEEEALSNREFAKNYEHSLNYTEEGAFVGFFNKNLENVQGDERDYIIISVGYAPSSVGGKLRKMFGPLSSKGGGRRLNVAITRAKKKIRVFCSFDPNELDTSEEAFSAKPDATCFARYLNYAKAVAGGELETAKNILAMFPVSGVATQRKPSRFNRDVKREIENLGYRVDTEVGSCGFYIDLGIEHPNVENTYMLGIECDGAIFHSSDYARDRDKARQALLEARGWKIHRIWSQDWSRNRAEEIERLRVTLESLGAAA